jgi:hypothetical protein
LDVVVGLGGGVMSFVLFWREEKHAVLTLIPVRTIFVKLIWNRKPWQGEDKRRRTRGIKKLIKKKLMGGCN